MMKNIINVDTPCSFPCGYTISDNRIEDFLQKHISPAAYVVWRQYLRFWGGGKKSAYPSLQLLSERTGLSEKTIRRANKELVSKGFLVYKKGDSGSPNKYYYVSIDKIMKKIYGKEVVESETQENEELQPIKEIKDKEIESLIKEERDPVLDSFINIFKTKYKEKFNLEYIPEKRDIKAIKNNIKDIKENFSFYINLIDMFFNSKNKFIINSDYSIYLFFVENVKRNIINEFSKTDRGRWSLQAEKLLNSIPKNNTFKSIEEAKEFTKRVVKLSGSNSTRDNFVIEYIANKLSGR